MENVRRKKCQQQFKKRKNLLPNGRAKNRVRKRIKRNCDHAEYNGLSFFMAFYCAPDGCGV